MYNRQIYPVVFCLMAAQLLSVTCDKAPSDSSDNTDPNTFEYLSIVTFTPKPGVI